MMPSGLYNKKKKLKREGIFHKTAEELIEFAKDNDIKNCGTGGCQYFICDFDSYIYKRVYLCKHPKMKQEKISGKEMKMVLRGKNKFPKGCPLENYKNENN